MLNSMDKFELKMYMELTLNEKINAKQNDYEYYMATGYVEHGFGDYADTLSRKYKRQLDKIIIGLDSGKIDLNDLVYPVSSY